MRNLIVVHQFGHWRVVLFEFRKKLFDSSGGIGIEHKNQTLVGFCGAHQIEAVLELLIQNSFMPLHRGRTGFQRDQSDQSHPRQSLALKLESLLVGVKRGRVVLCQDAVLHPLS